MVRYFEGLPEISFESVPETGVIELEVEGKVARLKNDVLEQIVFLGKMGATLYVVRGIIIFYDYVPSKFSVGGNDFTRLKIKGTCISST
jgi:hypothetical protein